jgi:hypothetical protein
MKPWLLRGRLSAMKTFIRLLLLVLGLTTATSVFYAVQQQKALEAARAAAEALERERSDLRERLRIAERRQSGERPSWSERAAQANDGLRAEAPAPAAPALPDGSPADFATAGRFAALLESPEAQRLLAMQQRSTLDSRYSALFRLLNLSPDQLEDLKDLLVEKRTAAADVLAAARTQGLNNRESRAEIRTLLEDTQAEIDGQIRTLLGESGFQRYQDFEQTQAQRAVVSRLEQRLSYSSLPLTPQQAEQLVQVFSADSPQRSDPNAGAARAAFAGQVTPISDQALAQAATVLNSAQLQALRALQQEQQAQVELNNLFRDRRAERGGPPASLPTTPPRG